jgi:hypothetical protein
MFSEVKNAVFRFLVILVTAVVATLCLGMNNLAFAEETNGIHPLGYAYVQANGSVLAARSQNITSANVLKSDSGIYGFRNLPFRPKNIQVTLAFDTQAITGDNRTGARGFIGDCSFVDGKDQACVSINSNPNTASTTETDDFFVVFY